MDSPTLFGAITATATSVAAIAALLVLHYNRRMTIAAELASALPRPTIQMSGHSDGSGALWRECFVKIRNNAPHPLEVLSVKPSGWLNRATIACRNRASTMQTAFGEILPPPDMTASQARHYPVLAFEVAPGDTVHLSLMVFGAEKTGSLPVAVSFRTSNLTRIERKVLQL
jgi:hypothetical protein